MDNFWSRFLEGFSSAKALPSFQKLFRENNCYPLDYDKEWGDDGPLSFLDENDLVCIACGRDDLTRTIWGKTICQACFVHDYFLSLPAPTKTYIEQIISDQGGRSEKEFSPDKKLPQYPTLSNWNITTLDFQRWFMKIRAVSNLPATDIRLEESMKKGLQKGIEKYATVLEKIRANSPDDIAAFLTLDNELWINLPNDIVLKITTHPAIPYCQLSFNRQVLICNREDFFRVLSQETPISTYSRSKLTDEDLYFLAYYTRSNILDLGSSFPFEEWFLNRSKRESYYNNGYVQSTNLVSDMWIANSNALSITFLKNEGFRIITPNELILNTLDTLIVKGDDTKTEFPYDAIVEDSLKLLNKSDYSDLPPSIFFKPEYPLIFKPSETTIYICIDPKGILTGHSGYFGNMRKIHPLFMKYKMKVLNEEKQSWYPEEGQQYFESRIRYHSQ